MTIDRGLAYMSGLVIGDSFKFYVSGDLQFANQADSIFDTVGVSDSLNSVDIDNEFIVFHRDGCLKQYYHINTVHSKVKLHRYRHILSETKGPMQQKLDRH